MNENDMLDADEELAENHERYEMEAMREEYEAEQSALPAHKRDGYAESLYELADMRRKEVRENGK